MNYELLKTKHTFFEDAEAATNGTVYTNDYYQGLINLEFFIATDTTFTAIVEAKLFGEWKTYYAITQNATMALVSEITDATAFYNIDMQGFTAVRVRLTAVTGTVSCYGKVVA